MGHTVLVHKIYYPNGFLEGVRGVGVGGGLLFCEGCCIHVEEHMLAPISNRHKISVKL